MSRYYLLIDRKEVGPYSGRLVRALLSEGEINGTTLGRCEGLPEWAEIREIIEPSDTPFPVTRPAETAVPIVQTNVKQRALLGGAVCLFVGLGFMHFTVFSVAIYGALLLAAFVLSIVAMAHGRVWGGMVLLVITLVAPYLSGAVVTWRQPPALADSFTQDSLKKQLEETQRKLSDQAGVSTPSDSTLSSLSAAPLNTTDSSLSAPPPDTSTTPASNPAPLPVASAATAFSTTSFSPGTNTVPVEVAAPPGPKHPALDEKFGFRGFRLGTSFSQFRPDQLQAEETDGSSDTKPFFVKTFDRQLGAAQIDSIQLDFTQDILQSVRVEVKGDESALALRDSLIAAYGKPDKDQSFLSETLTWEGDDCVLQLHFDMGDGGATAEFSSKSVDDQIKAITEEKAKAGAAAGAQNL
jgi:hypothetical protein